MITTSNVNITNFDFYSLDENPALLAELKEHLAKADYIFVPSRRIFANQTCTNPVTGLLRRSTPRNDERCSRLKQQYPLLNEYYEKLFSGQLGYHQVAEFSSYPALHVASYTLHFPDETAEETWTVFDHPVVRIYKRTQI